MKNHIISLSRTRKWHVPPFPQAHSESPRNLNESAGKSKRASWQKQESRIMIAGCHYYSSLTECSNVPQGVGALWLACYSRAVWSSSLSFAGWIVWYLKLLYLKFQALASLCSWAGPFKSYLVANPEDRFSRDVLHISRPLHIHKQPAEDSFIGWDLHTFTFPAQECYHRVGFAYIYIACTRVLP